MHLYTCMHACIHVYAIILVFDICQFNVNTACMHACDSTFFFCTIDNEDYACRSRTGGLPCCSQLSRSFLLE